MGLPTGLTHDRNLLDSAHPESLSWDQFAIQSLASQGLVDRERRGLQLEAVGSTGTGAESTEGLWDTCLSAMRQMLEGSECPVPRNLNFIHEPPRWGDSRLNWGGAPANPTSRG